MRGLEASDSRAAELDLVQRICQFNVSHFSESQSKAHVCGTFLQPFLLVFEPLSDNDGSLVALFWSNSYHGLFSCGIEHSKCTVSVTESVMK